MGNLGTKAKAMQSQTRTFYLQFLPFLISLFVGTAIFAVAELGISHVGFSSLLIGVASYLMGIPAIFIFFDMINRASGRRVNRLIMRHIIFEMNYITISLLRDLKTILGFREILSKSNLYAFLSAYRRLEGRKFKFNASHAEKFRQYKERILNLMYTNVNIGVVPENILQTLLSIAKELGILGIEISQKKPDQRIVRAALETIINDLDVWVEFCEVDAIVNHHGFSIAK